MAIVSAFMISMYSGIENRITKPFNPTLGETFEMMGDGWRYVAEQVSHHPPVSAAFAESSLYELRENTAMTQTFDGNKLTFVPTGTTNIKFKDNGDEFVA